MPTTLSITILGSGTSAGVPMIGCDCPVCRSTDPRDKRTRPSIAVHYDNKSILLDTTPELRLQSIANHLHKIDAVIYTHAHADHIFGLDDVRRFNTVLGAPLPLYADPATMEKLRHTFAYAFKPPEPPEQKKDSLFRPELLPHMIDLEGNPPPPFDLLGRAWQPIPLIHGKTHVLGFRINNFAYCTDCSAIPEESKKLLQNLDLLIIDGLRPRPHPTHLSFTQALAIIAELKPARALFTHLSHDVKHTDIEKDLPPHVRVAYDGLIIDV